MATNQLVQDFIAVTNENKNRTNQLGLVFGNRHTALPDEERVGSAIGLVSYLRETLLLEPLVDTWIGWLSVDAAYDRLQPHQFAFVKEKWFPCGEDDGVTMLQVCGSWEVTRVIVKF